MSDEEISLAPRGPRGATLNIRGIDRDVWLRARRAAWGQVSMGELVSNLLENWLTHRAILGADHEKGEP